jgi:magnesium-transporting ATPase (P-type)
VPARRVFPTGPTTPQEIRYEAESPDEAALVVAAKVFGFFMFKRTNTTITLRERMPDGMHEREYDVLNLLEFNSTRKRMSVIVKDRQTGRMVLYCKVRGCTAVLLNKILLAVHEGCVERESVCAMHLCQSHHT